MNVTVPFEIEGVARRQLKQSDALKEQKQFVNTIWHQKKKVNNNFFFEQKLPSVSNFVFTRPTVKSGVYHPKNCILLSLTSLTILTFFSHRRKKKIVADCNLQALTLVETLYRCVN